MFVRNRANLGNPRASPCRGRLDERTPPYRGLPGDEGICRTLDDLYAKWYADKSAAGRYRADSLPPPGELPVVPDETYLARLDTLHSAIPLS